MKKVLAIVLSLSMVLGSFGFAFAAEDDTSKTKSTKSTNFSDVVGTDCEDAVKVLTDLNVVTGYDDGTYKPENIVTRAEMAVLVVNALGLKSYVTEGAKSTFTDMANYGWAEGYIAYAQSLGVISGYGDGTFQPGKTVSYDEVATMLVAALGYTPEALQGTWPANYVTQAKAKGILDGITAGPNGANRGDVATMIYQTLDQGIGKVDKDGNWQQIGITFNPNGSIKEQDTMLNRLGAKLYNKSGDMDGDQSYFFVVTKDIADNESVINLYPYIGTKMSAYMNSDDDIIAVKEVKSTFLTGEFDGIDTFTVGDTDYDVKIQKNAYGYAEYFQNAEDQSKRVNTVTTTSDAALSDSRIDWTGNTTSYTLAVDLSGKTIKDIYSIMQWDVTEADYFASTDAADIKDDHEIFGIDLPEDDNGDIDTNKIDLIGVDSLDAIKTDDVVYAYKHNTDDEIVRVAVGTEVVSGEVSRVNKDNDEFTISGKVYSAADSTVRAYNGTIKAGDTVTLYLDAYGEVYDYKKGAGEPDKYAIVLDVAEGSKTLNGDPAKVKLFLADGSVKTFEMDDDIVDESQNGAPVVVTTNNGVSVTIPTLATANARSLTAGAIIKYDTDKAGVIDDVELPTNQVVGSAAKTAVSPKGNFDGKKINSDAVLYTYDYEWINLTPTTSGIGDMTDDDNFGTATYDSILDSDDTTARYVVDADGNISAMILGDFSTTTDTYGVFTNWANGSGDYDYIVNVWINGKLEEKSAEKAAMQKAAVTADAPHNPSGAVYKLKFDGTKAIKDGTAVSVGKNTADKTTRTDLTTVGAVLLRDGKVIKVSGSALSYTLDDDAVVYTWSYTDNKYKKGNLGDIAKTLSASAVNTTNAVELYDVVDNDGVYDIVLVY